MINRVVDNPPLLSITIPTWNRSKILNQSLGFLLPQIEKHKNEIELIISDNDSNDDTQQIINKYIKKYPNINIISHLQEVNKGYYGNFKKCKELAKGSYLWLLSDNEFVNIGLIDVVIKTIKENSNIFAIHLNDWNEYKNKRIKPNYKTLFVNKNQLFKEAGHKLTLISAVIFKNDESKDFKIFTKFIGNPFLGFIFFLQAFESGEKAAIISGVSLLSISAQISFNVFDAFAIHLVKCISYATEEKLISKQQEHIFMNSIIKNISLNHYISYKINGKIYNGNFGLISDIEGTFTKGFFKYENFNNLMQPCFKTSKQNLFIKYYLKKLKNKCIKLLKIFKS